MPSDQTPRQPGATPSQGTSEAGLDADFSQALAGESGDPIWESDAPQPESGRTERARRAMREPEGKVPPGRLIDLVQGQRRPGAS
jgi:hypothetical protein